MKSRKLLWLGASLSLAVFLAGAVALAVRPAAALPPRPHVTTGDFPMYMGDSSHSGANLFETSITSTTGKYLRPSWQFTTGGPIVASPTIANGVMYIGSWDGNEYAINLTTHQQIWKQFLGLTQQSKTCYGGTVGVSSTAAVAYSTVQGNIPGSSPTPIIFVGGGDGNFYALNGTTGAVIWKTFLGAPPYYNWSSPVIYQGHIYIGLAAYCDPPFVQGKVLSLNIADGSVAASVSLVPDGQTGAPIWSSPAVDPATGHIIVSTGNNGSQVISQQPNSEAILSLDHNTLAVLDHWQIPAAQQVSDSDFGASPILFSANGVNFVGALNKNGIFYALNRANLAAGPVWQVVVSTNSQTIPGDNVSNACYNNGMVYIGAAGSVINSKTYGGAVTAVNAATGAVSWQVNTLGAMNGPVICTSSLVTDVQGNLAEVRSAATGQLLYSYDTGSQVNAAAVVSHGILYTASTTGVITAFALANTNIPGLIFQDNLDFYAAGPVPQGQGTGQWTGQQVKGTDFGVTVENTVSHSAPNALQFTVGATLGGNCWVFHNYGAANGYTTHAAEFYFNLGTLTLTTGPVALFVAQNRTNTLDGSAAVIYAPNQHLQVVWYDSTGAKHVSISANTLTDSNWHKIELDQTNDPVNGSITLWVDGQAWVSVSSVDTGNLPVTAFVAGDHEASTSTLSGSFYEDDIVTATQFIG